MTGSGARTIGVVTVSRSDYGIYTPLLRCLMAEPQLRLHLIVAGTHLAPEFGMTVRAIEADGFPIGERVNMLLASDAPEGIAKAMGLGTLGFAQAYARSRPDLLVVLGDRFDMHAAAVAAVPFNMPVAHIHGGELTLGAFDDCLRHSITKLSHLHFAATRDAARRIEQLGEEPWRITVCGAPGLDNVRTVPLLSRSTLERKYGLRLDPPPLLVTYHPVTLEFEQTEQHMRALIEALRRTQLPVIFTQPNADTAGRVVQQLIDLFLRETPQAQYVPTFGQQDYFSVMACARAMVGNSSSGIIEAPSFALPVVNIGTRQEGRVRAANVIDVGYAVEDIVRGIRQAAEPGVHERLRGLTNPYGDGHASEVIVERLKHVTLDDRLLMKRFVDLPAGALDAVPA